MALLESAEIIENQSFSFGNDDEEIPILLLKQEIGHGLIDDLRRKTDEALFVLFHELGHLVNKDVVAVGEDFDRYNQLRKDNVSSGAVLVMELGADDFAAKYLGVQAAVRGLCALIEREKAYYPPDVFDPADIEITLEELRNRIQHFERNL